jgi:UDP-N-acetylglucosamine acyltransferase
MACAHVAHDCILGDNVIMGNGAGLAGHIEVGDFAIISGMCAVHQFVKIGEHVMIAGGSLVRKDVPPYVKAAREPLSYAGVNSIGLRRRGFTNQIINEIQDVYRKIFQQKMNITQAVCVVEAELPATPERDKILAFINNSTRGLMKGYIGMGKRYSNGD